VAAVGAGDTFSGEKAVIIHTSSFPVKGGANFVFSRDEKVRGPWSHPLGAKIRHRHDPSLFQDEDGTWWMIWGATRIAALKDDFSNYKSEPIVIGPKPSQGFKKMGHGTPFRYKNGQWWCTAFFNANVPPLSKEGIQERDLSETAQTINQQGVTLVPIEMKILDDGDVGVRALDKHYCSPGPDEAQKFADVNGFWR
jgi:xylan 1,4-beta-xylosidase